MNLADLEGLVSEATGEALAALAEGVDAQAAIVELGSYKGKSTAYLAVGAKRGHGAKVWAVDAWDTPGNVTGRFGFAEPSTRQRFEEQLRSVRLWSRVTPLQGFSVDVAATWDGPPVALLFIDADHEAARADFDAWAPHLVPQARVVFDDIDTPKNPGVRSAVDGLVVDGRIAALDIPADTHLAVCTFVA